MCGAAARGKVSVGTSTVNRKRTECCTRRPEWRLHGAVERGVWGDHVTMGERGQIDTWPGRFGWQW
jgi:hypothetical protein